jgi:PhnB protein
LDWHLFFLHMLKAMKTTAEKKPQAIPKEYSAVTPWIISSDSARLIDFMHKAFEAEEIAGSRMSGEDGSIMHVEVKIGDAIVMLFDSGKNWPSTPAFMRLYVGNSKSVFDNAIRAGAKAITNLTNLAFGDRVGRISDPLGNIWWIQERLEDLTNEPPEAAAERSGTPEAQQAMEYVMRSLNEEMQRRKKN